ncbi:MAG: hypothetical protein IPH82_13410 [Chloroflexi bacterium]|nr:hypothetical protein [Chloroflexota bacterium]
MRCKIELPEVRVRVAEDGAVSIRPLPNLRSRDLVRDAMLLAGEAIARFAFSHNIPLPYTTRKRQPNRCPGQHDSRIFCPPPPDETQPTNSAPAPTPDWDWACTPRPPAPAPLP